MLDAPKAIPPRSSRLGGVAALLLVGFGFVSGVAFDTGRLSALVPSAAAAPALRAAASPRPSSANARAVVARDTDHSTVARADHRLDKSPPPAAPRPRAVGKKVAAKPSKVAPATLFEDALSR